MPEPGPRIRPTRQTLSPPDPDFAELVVADADHYTIIKELARGGMGRVMLARDRRLGRDVAVKEVISDARAIARRFEREARITARLQHPSIIAVHEAGRWPSGAPFYVMPVVTGDSLDAAIDKAYTPAQRAALVPHVLAVADAMAYAHARGVIHRDLKPRNILIGNYGETVVLDWGLAKDMTAPDGSGAGDSGAGTKDTESATPTASPEPRQTADGDTTIGEVLGTPAYMPPEQAHGQPVDARADVYSIGAILYHALAGRPPFVARSSVELLTIVAESAPPPLRELVPDVPTELAAIVERAMAREPAARYATAGELAEDLHKFHTGQLVGAHRYSTRQLVWRWLRRHRTAVAAVMAATVATVAIGVVAVRRVVAAEQVARDERAEAVSRRDDAEQLMQFMLVDLQGKLAEVGRLDLLDAVARRASTYYDNHAATSAEDAFLAAVARVGLGHVLEQRNDLRGALGQYVEAWSTLETIAAQHPEIARYTERALDAGVHVGDVERSQGDLAAALELYTALAARTEPALAAMPGDAELLKLAAGLRSRIAYAFEDRGDTDKALASTREQLALAERLAKVEPGAASDKQLLNAHGQIGRVLFKGKVDTTAALPEYRLALELSERLVARQPRDPRWLQDAAISHDDVGQVLAAQGDAAGALAEYRKGVALADRAVGIDPSNTEMVSTRATLGEKVGIALFAQKDYAGAAVEYAACDAAWSQLAAKDPTNTEWARGRSVIVNKLGDVALAQHDLATALTRYQSALALRLELAKKDASNVEWQRDVLYSHFKLATVYDAEHDLAKAIVELRAATTAADAALAAHPSNRAAADDAAEIRDNLGDELRDAGDLPAARRAYNDGAAIARRLAAQNPGDAGWAKLVDKLEAKARK